MASNLRVDNIQPSTGTGIGIGTANGSVTITGDLSVDTSKGLTVGTGATIYGSTNTITAFTNGSERVRITSGGNIGIGKDNPIRNVHISGTTTNILRLENTNANVAGIELTGSTGQSSIFHNNDDLRFLPSGTEKLRITSTGDVRIINGNLVFSTSGTGIDFSANGNAAGMTSELLDDYEEGTWTPTQGNLSTWTSPTFSANYTKIGRLVQVNIYQTGGTIGWSAQEYIGGLPFAPSSPGSAYATDNYPDSDNGPLLIWTSSNIYFHTANASEAGLIFTAIYHTS